MKFAISDTHFNHDKIILWGRNQFQTIEEHDDYIVEQINKTMTKNDILYHCGDVVMNVCSDNIESVLERTIGRINCKMHLAIGNHDTPAKLKYYSKYFDKICGYYEHSKFIMSHIPIHPRQLERFHFNVHGHTHSENETDLRYFNASCENINFTPISFDDIVKQLNGE